MLVLGFPDTCLSWVVKGGETSRLRCEFRERLMLLSFSTGIFRNSHHHFLETQCDVPLRKSPLHQTDASSPEVS